MLREGQEAALYLRNTNKESEVYTVTSRWLNVCCTGLDTFRERLSLDDVVAKDEATHSGAGARSNHAIDKPGSSNRWCRCR